MLYLKLRFYLIFLFAFIGLVLHIEIGFHGAWYLYLAALILLLTHVLFNNVWAAFTQLRKGQIDEAEILINGIKKPQWLAPRHKAYYHFTKGMIALQRKEMPDGKDHLKFAIDKGLRSKNDNALAALNLAHIYFVEKEMVDAKSFLDRAKSFQSDDLMIKENISKLEKILQPHLN